MHPKRSALLFRGIGASPVPRSALRFLRMGW